MKPALIDTDILSRFFRADPNVVAHFARYLAEHGRLSISIVTYYEVLSGLLHRDARKQLGAFRAFCDESEVLPLTSAAADHAARLYAETRKAGTPVDDIDLLIAGIALAHGRIVVTHNTDHFGRLSGVTVEDWSAAQEQGERADPDPYGGRST
jgi:tRNA(fMet)-specific endonuclease VapC